MSERETIAAEVEAIRESGALGRSELIRRLFDYLADRTLDQRTPKEAEVGADVFGRSPAFDPGQDAVVRVYVHKLRRKLDGIYAGGRQESPVRLNIPRGEYRLVAEPLNVATTAAPTVHLPDRRPIWLVAMLVLALAVGVGTWMWSRSSLPPLVRQGLQLRRGPIWGPILSNRLPTLIVLGDYYIFGDSDDGMDVDRLVREYTVNSRADLNAFLVEHPQRAMHYIDLDLRYLPVGSAFALRSVASVLAFGDNPTPPRVILASSLTPEMVRTNNLVYIGYFSALGPLRNTVFAGSRFSVGDNYDQILDSRTKRRYISQGGGPDSDGEMYRDYGYLSAFKGPLGSRIIIIAGTRDIGLMQTAEAATNLPALKDLERRAGAGDAFEALYDVEGINRQNVGGQLLVASPVDSAGKWRGVQGAAKAFPAG